MTKTRKMNLQQLIESEMAKIKKAEERIISEAIRAGFLTSHRIEAKTMAEIIDYELWDTISEKVAEYDHIIICAAREIAFFQLGIVNEGEEEIEKTLALIVGDDDLCIKSTMSRKEDYLSFLKVEIAEMLRNQLTEFALNLRDDDTKMYFKAYFK